MMHQSIETNEYQAAREALNWTHQEIALRLGAGLRTCYRYNSGKEIPPDRRRLLRLLVLLRLTLPEKKFEDIVKQL